MRVQTYFWSKYLKKTALISSSDTFLASKLKIKKYDILFWSNLLCSNERAASVNQLNVHCKQILKVLALLTVFKSKS
jgi:hypothetical protein